MACINFISCNPLLCVFYTIALPLLTLRSGAEYNWQKMMWSSSSSHLMVLYLTWKSFYGNFKTRVSLKKCMLGCI
jgi:hypothetical protein